MTPIIKGFRAVKLVYPHEFQQPLVDKLLADGWLLLDVNLRAMDNPNGSNVAAVFGRP